jgi:predicted Zn-dependent protease
MTRDEARAIVESAIKLSRADEIQVSVSAGDERNVRFADNRITTAGSTSDLSIRVFSAFGKKQASATGNDTTPDGIERLVRLSETLARLSPENPEAMPLLGPQTYTPVDNHFESTAKATAEMRARAAGTAIEAAKKAGDVTAAGILITNNSANAVGNNRGLFAFRESTSADFSTTVRSTDGTGSGWGGANHPDWTKLDFAGASQAATSKARLSRNPTAIEPGQYTVILEPEAAGNLVSLVIGSLDARSADEGRSAFSKPGGGTFIGEKIVDERVTFVSDPADPQLLGSDFDGEGLPLGRRVWVDKGVLNTLSYSRFWAQKQGKQPTGGGGGGSVKMAGTDQTIEQLIASTERGVLVTRFWYIRPVNARTLLYTGLTRDGTFLIENGRIARSIRNMRFNESPLFMLNKLEGIGQAKRLSDNLVMPSLKVRDFTFSSLSDAV